MRPNSSKVKQCLKVYKMVAFTFTMRRHLIWLSSAPFTPFRLAKCGWAPFADLRVRRLAKKQNAEFTESRQKLRCHL